MRQITLTDEQYCTLMYNLGIRLKRETVPVEILGILDLVATIKAQSSTDNRIFAEAEDIKAKLKVRLQ